MTNFRIRDCGRQRDKTAVKAGNIILLTPSGTNAFICYGTDLRNENTK
jgi:hypothetical protein